MKNKLKTSKGITLIALVITIIVLLILAGVAISMLTGDNGILNQAARAKQRTGEASVEEQVKLAAIAAMANEKHTIAKEELIKELAKYGLKLDDEEIDVWTVTDQEVVYVIDSNGRVEKSEEVIIDGTKVTPKNITKYLGKKVTNYTGKESVEIDGESYTVSPTYRLYYIDFGGKYGEKGTIYLKAECTKNEYTLPNTDTTAKDNIKIKIDELNPGLYIGGEGPTTSNNSMKAVTWLTNTKNWESLADTNHSDDINYIVGAPSLEMMMDSYNTHYNLTGDTPQTGTLDNTSTGSRAKLFYQYTQGDNGYKVGPSDNNEWGTFSSNYSVKTDSAIDTIYYPGSSQCYWLASPSTDTSSGVMKVDYSTGGYVCSRNCFDDNSLCPLVSLKSTVQLTLES